MTPAHEPGATHARDVRAMFTRIAHRYDLMNSLMTGGRHHAWRRVAAGAVLDLPPGPVLDLATGTADLALDIRRLAPARRVVGADFSEGMLREGRRKLVARGEGGIALVAADAQGLPFADATFAAVTSAFLLRNLADLPGGLAEMRRVTLKDGAVIALEIVQPTLRGWAPLFNVYFRRFVPMVGALVARDRQAYTYLPRSVARFVSPPALTELMTHVGLRDVHYRRLGLGTIAIHIGRV